MAKKTLKQLLKWAERYDCRLNADAGAWTVELWFKSNMGNYKGDTLYKALLAAYNAEKGK